jgi:hypothetical protein
MPGGKNIGNEDFKLAAGGVISGKVSENGTGKPLKDFTLSFISSDNDKIIREAHVHDDGTYKIHLAQGVYQVSCWQNSGKYSSSDQTISMKDGETKTLNYDSVPPLQTVHGVILDSTGNPAKYASVTVYNRSFLMMLCAGEDGKFQIDTRSGDYIMAQMDQTSSSAPVQIKDGDSEIKLVPGSSVHEAIGQVVDSNGKPIKGAKVFFNFRPFTGGSGGSGMGQRETDEQGKYSFARVYAGLYYN